MPYIEVVAAVLRQDNKFLIAKRKADQHVGGKWEFPGGKIEKEETPEACLKRELFEEFGIEANVDSFFIKTKITPAGDFCFGNLTKFFKFRRINLSRVPARDVS